MSPTLYPVTCSLGEGGVTDQKSNHSGLSEPHPGPSDPFPGGGRRHRPEKQPKWIKWALPWTQRPVPWGRGELQTRKVTKVEQVSPTRDPMTRSLGEGGVTDQRSNQSGTSEPHLDPVTHSQGEGGDIQTRKGTKVDQVNPTLDQVTRSLGEGGDTDQKSNQSGSSEPHPGPSDPFPGGGGSYRPEKQP